MEIGTLAQWAGATATFFAVLVALFKDEFLRWRRKPKLRVSIKLASPDCQKTRLTYMVQKEVITSETADCYYFRLWVENEGKTRAERVQVFASKLLRKKADGCFQDVDSFLPMNLRWTHSNEIFTEGISPEMGRHCDLGRIVDPELRKNVGEDLPTLRADETVLALILEVQPSTMSHLVAPGVYRLELRVAAANCLPASHTLELTITGKWFIDQDRMFSDGLGIKAIT
jgi:hypothetical protein